MKTRGAENHRGEFGHVSIRALLWAQEMILELLSCRIVLREYWSEEDEAYNGESNGADPSRNCQEKYIPNSVTDDECDIPFFSEQYDCILAHGD